MDAGRAKILTIETPAGLEKAVRAAAQILKSGGVVAVPTETVYGLAANALDGGAVAKIYEAKGRPSHNPIIVHVADLEMARSCVAEWPSLADQLRCAFWPGPLTMVLKKAAHIPSIVTSGGLTVAIRWPSHPFMQALIKACGFPLAAPSANPSNQISPTTAQHVAKGLGDKIPLIIDAGLSNVGIESTVIDLTVSPPVILRPGMISSEAMKAVIGPVAENRKSPAENEFKSPGMLEKHYSPKADLHLWRWASTDDLFQKIRRSGLELQSVHVIAHTVIPVDECRYGRVSVIPDDAEAFARAIYAELHSSDEAGAKNIIVEALPETAEWKGIQDRLNRASRK